jgi:sugar phosphate isomerase/epimerase
MDLPILKNRFPFRLGAPSFIYPAGYVENVRRLGPHLDELELLFFESAPGSFPDVSEIAALCRSGEDMGLSYNVHLPVDLHLGHADAVVRQAAVRRLSEVLSHCRPLNATTHTLHLSYAEPESTPEAVELWQARILESLHRLFEISAIAPQRISVETLDYPPVWLRPILAEFPLRVCLDVGHLLHHGLDLSTVLEGLKEKIVIVHLHGTAQERDHQALDVLSPSVWELLKPFVADFKGTLSLEVFSPERLAISMRCLQEMTDRWCKEPT